MLGFIDLYHVELAAVWYGFYPVYNPVYSQWFITDNRPIRIVCKNTLFGRLGG